VDLKKLVDQANQTLEGLDEKERGSIAREVARDLKRISTEEALLRERQKVAFQIIDEGERLQELELDALGARLEELLTISPQRQQERLGGYGKYRLRVPQVTVRWNL